MKGLRGAALGLVVVLCLLAAAPAAFAEDTWTPRAVVGNPGDWLAEWAARIAGWFGWGEGQPQAITEAEAGETQGPGAAATRSPAPAPVTDGDCSGGLDPTGAPCRP